MSGEWQFTDFYDMTPKCQTCGGQYWCMCLKPNYFGNKKEEKPSLKQYTDITVLLDRSGSMESIKPSMEEAFNGFIKGHKVNPSTKVSLVQFDGPNDQDVVFQCVPVGAVEPLRLSPRGSTPLVDAFVKCIDRTGERLSNMNESDRPDQVLFVVITDGEENASRHYRRSDVQSRVSKQNRDYKWQFVYLGANQDAIKEAQSYGINPMYAMGYNATQIGTASAGAAFTANTVAYASSTGGDRLRSTSLKFTDKQRKEAVEDTVTTTTTTDKV